MSQSLILFPKEAHLEIMGVSTGIRNHRVITRGGLTGFIIGVVWRPESRTELQVQFERQGISFEAAIEECARELEYDEKVLADLVINHYINRIKWGGDVTEMDRYRINSFSESKTGRIIADQYIEKIRNCSNWGELHDEMQLTTKFHKDMKRRILKEVKQKCRKV